jgi:hypothetical protein
MDTRFWGPSGWSLLHSVLYNATDNNTHHIYQFIETLPYILPCKYCRASLTDYYRELPYEDTPPPNLFKWSWQIHNKVNDKLRKQGLHMQPNPPFTAVRDFYKKLMHTDPTLEAFSLNFWDFLFAIAYNHPKETQKTSKPMPECPSDVTTCRNEAEKNKWNVMSYDDRYKWYIRFWKCLPDIMPTEILRKKWKDAYKQYCAPNISCRRSTLAWLWRLRCHLDPDFKDPYTQVCKSIAAYSSECSKNTSKRVKTCRKKRM